MTNKFEDCEKLSQEEAYNKIEEILDGKDLENIPRKKYIEIYHILGKQMWEACPAATVGDIADFVNEKPNEVFDNIVDFTDNKEKISNLLKKDDAIYTDIESDKFMNKVISSNITDISDSGYFYKKLMSSCDDIRIVEDDCMSEGKEIKVSDITEELYNYKIRFSFVTQIEDYAKDLYVDFINNIRKFKTINVRTPMECNDAPNRGLCKKCAGVIKRNYDTFFIPKNYGIFVTLAITEHATQSSLDSMNKGVSKNINTALDQKTSKLNMSWKEVKDEFKRIVDEIGYIGVQSRFYEVALMSRVYEDQKNPGIFRASSFKSSFIHQNDPLGVFIYSPSFKNLLKMLSVGEFEASSIKSKIMFDNYEE